MKIPTPFGAKPMTKNETPSTALAAALHAIDFTGTNAEIARLEAERITFREKADLAAAEAERLRGEIQDWNGPDADALADAMLKGKSPAEAALSAPSREQLADQRAAMLATAGALREREERARVDRDEVKRTQNLAVADAAADFIEAMIAVQERAARELIDAIAAVDAIIWATDAYNTRSLATRRARQGLTGMDSVLGHIDRLAVPAEVVAALQPLTERANGLRAPVPSHVSNN